MAKRKEWFVTYKNGMEDCIAITNTAVLNKLRSERYPWITVLSALEIKTPDERMKYCEQFRKFVEEKKERIWEE